MVSESPIEKFKLVASEHGLVAIFREKEKRRRVPLDDHVEDAQQPILTQTEAELREYFAGKRTTFTVPLHMRGTASQKQVWEVLIGIPYGETRTYGQLAIQLGNPRATRAVGAANGRNPVAIIAPCHA